MYISVTFATLTSTKDFVLPMNNAIAKKSLYHSRPQTNAFSKGFSASARYRQGKLIVAFNHTSTDQHDKPYLATSYYAVNDPAAKLAVANSLADIFPSSPFFKNCLKLLLVTAYIMFLIIS